VFRSRQDKKHRPRSLKVHWSQGQRKLNYSSPSPIRPFLGPDHHTGLAHRQKQSQLFGSSPSLEHLQPPSATTTLNPFSSFNQALLLPTPTTALSDLRDILPVSHSTSILIHQPSTVARCTPWHFNLPPPNRLPQQELILETSHHRHHVADPTTTVRLVCPPRINSWHICSVQHCNPYQHHIS
jgi:hypothetical protein